MKNSRNSQRSSRENKKIKIYEKKLQSHHWNKEKKFDCFFLCKDFLTKKKLWQSINLEWYSKCGLNNLDDLLLTRYDHLGIELMWRQLTAHAHLLNKLIKKVLDLIFQKLINVFFEQFSVSFTMKMGIPARL